MPNWKKLLVSGSDASLNSLTVVNGITGSLFGTSSWANNAITASYALNAVSASYAATASNVEGYSISGSNDYVPLWQASGSLSRSVIYQKGNDTIGINRTNVTLTLDVLSLGGNQIANFETQNFGDVYIQLKNNLGYGYIGVVNRDFYFQPGGLTKAILSASGEFGLGTFTPKYTLDVVGSGNLSNGLTATGSIKLPSLTNVNQLNIVGYDTTTGQLYYQSTSSLSVTSASYAVTASYATTSSYINPLRQDVTITGSLDLSTVGNSEVLFKSGSVTGSNSFTWNNGSKQLTVNGGSAAGQFVSIPVGNDGTYIGAQGSTDAGLFSNNSDQIIATFDASNNLYEYSNGFYKYNATGTTHSLTGSIKLPSLTGVNQTNVVGYDTTTGQLYYQSTSSLSITSASYAVSASYAQTASYAFAIPDQGYQFTQAVTSSTWTINHNLNTLTPLVDVYDSSYNQLIPAGIQSTTANTTIVTFSSAITGYAIVSKGSGINSETALTASLPLLGIITASAVNTTITFTKGNGTTFDVTVTQSGSVASASYADFAVTASYASTVGYNFEQLVGSTTWTVNHNLNNRHPLVQVYDSNHLVLIPQSISGSNVNTTIITFSTSMTGYARIV